MFKALYVTSENMLTVALFALVIVINFQSIGGRNGVAYVGKWVLRGS
jgi:hypothetical protein